VPPPKNLPAVAALRVDANGNVWVQAGYRPTAREVAWSVFDPKSRWLGDVTLPAALTVLEIGTDYMIVRDRDEVDVERVRVLGIRRN
jgi:hypothetical protein